MELVNQHTKEIMEGCKERAKKAGLIFGDETLEYIVTNRDLLELSPKMMIPTLYDYWVHDVEVLKEKGKYELYPSNPYETVINTRPAISFYNDNNPDWLNVMIFYHVIAHIDFFQNNLYFRNTWDDDFTGQALSDKRTIAALRSEKGRWVDYVIEFSRGIDNLVGYYDTLSQFNRASSMLSTRLDYYFDVFLQSVKKVTINEFIKEVERYNHSNRDHGKMGEQSFFLEVAKKYPEFDALYKKSIENSGESRLDIIQFLMEYSDFLNKEANKWMKSVLQVVRKTSLFFQPQIRTKIMNEGWASYWHEMLFLNDDRISGHEVEFARVNSGVTAMPRVGLNPYALGMRLFYYLEDMADKGRYSIEFQRLADAEGRKNFDKKTGQGRDFIFRLRENFCDFTFINTFIDQDFVNRHNLFVAGKRLNESKMTWEYYVKSKDAHGYRQMLLDSLYHPPHIEIDQKKGENGLLYMRHHFEGKPLVEEFINNTMMGIEYLWGGPVQLETSQVESISPPPKNGLSAGMPSQQEKQKELEIKWRRVLYTMKDRRLSKKNI
ncbi:SpoVR-like family protein [uncultured Desulfobacterium sp.]|uniref:SpoVR-like family protein n=1 Tax=uncultured Desulfobacterium sp. TaxID=201089 RepID=A0A445N414_9BACT|nr:SpoVR-like family protein [uncultured Desulfobacterium sp.]